jgi:transposase
MDTGNTPQTPQGQARRRAQLIVEVRSGKKTAALAAAELGVSRKTWYKWENRALEAMVEALTDRPTGRPNLPAPDPERLRMEAELCVLRRRVQQLETLEHIRELMRTVQGPPEALDVRPYDRASKKKPGRQSSS